MKCPRCGQMIAGLACPACTALKSREAIFQNQGRHSPDVRKGRLPFYAKRPSSRAPWHLMLFGDKAHSLCGTEIMQVGPNNRRDVFYRELEKLRGEQALCLKCLNAWLQIEEREAIREES